MNIEWSRFAVCRIKVGKKTPEFELSKINNSMKKQPLCKQLWLLIGLMALIINAGSGQSTGISLEEAIRIARENYAGLERDRLTVEQQQALAGSGLLTQPTQLFFSGEEFDFNGQSGVQFVAVRQVVDCLRLQPDLVGA